jgi:hypothetical protein
MKTPTRNKKPFRIRINNQERDMPSVSTLEMLQEKQRSNNGEGRIYEEGDMVCYDNGRGFITKVSK